MRVTRPIYTSNANALTRYIDQTTELTRLQVGDKSTSPVNLVVSTVLEAESIWRSVYLLLCWVCV